MKISVPAEQNFQCAKFIESFGFYNPAYVA